MSIPEVGADPFFFLAPLAFFVFIIYEMASPISLLTFFTPPAIYLVMMILARQEKKFVWLNYGPFAFVSAVFMTIWFLASAGIIEYFFHKIEALYILVIYLAGILAVLPFSKRMIRSRIFTTNPVVWGVCLIFLIMSIGSIETVSIYAMVGVSALCGEHYRLLPKGMASAYLFIELLLDWICKVFIFDKPDMRFCLIFGLLTMINIASLHFYHRWQKGVIYNGQDNYEL